MSITQSDRQRPETAAANSQAFEFVPLVTLLTATEIDQPSPAPFRFQTHDRNIVTAEGYEFDFLDTAIPNTSGSQIPYSPYYYSMYINNTNTSGSINTKTTTQRNRFDSLRNFIISNDGLRNGTMSVYYSHRNKPRANHTAKYRIDRSTVSIYHIKFDLIVPFDTIIPNHLR